MRDAIQIVAYSPFHDSSFEETWSIFYLVSSFFQNSCQENFLDFKNYFGQIVPDLGCRQHKTQNLSLIEDLQSVLLKFLWFSGLSRNKSPNILISDKLVSTPTVVRIFRCIISMVTGPCRSNQLKIYMGGTQIWLNILSRVINELDSEYYLLMSVTLDYILSLIEGNCEAIINYFAAAFDIPLMYNLTVVLVMKLKNEKIQNFKQKPLSKFSGNESYLNGSNGKSTSNKN